MAANHADAKTVQEIRRLAADESRVRVTRQALSDLMAHGLKKADVCDEIVAWIDRNEPVKQVTIHTIPSLLGQPAYEVKPRMRSNLFNAEVIFYIKVTLVELGQPDEYMLVISTHPDH
jgi:hypothetical protein